jgi:hypothetical protein
VSPLRVQRKRGEEQGEQDLERERNTGVKTPVALVTVVMNVRSLIYIKWEKKQ